MHWWWMDDVRSTPLQLSCVTIPWMTSPKPTWPWWAIRDDFITRTRCRQASPFSMPPCPARLQTGASMMGSSGLLNTFLQVLCRPFSGCVQTIEVVSPESIAPGRTYTHTHIHVAVETSACVVMTENILLFTFHFSPHLALSLLQHSASTTPIHKWELSKHLTCKCATVQPDY